MTWVRAFGEEAAIDRVVALTVEEPLARWVAETLHGLLDDLTSRLVGVAGSMGA